MRLNVPAVLAALVLLAACSPMLAPVAVEEELATPKISAGLASDTACLPGDDGIGGTGCKVD